MPAGYGFEIVPTGVRPPSVLDRNVVDAEYPRAPIADSPVSLIGGTQ